MRSKSEKEIYFHVGLGKTASTYLQYKVFPKIKGAYYIQRTKYRQCDKIIERTNHTKYLVSREFDNQLEAEVEKFANKHPQAKIIMILRRHDRWIASQYRRFIKNGRPASFKEFIDIEHDTGIWRRDKLFFMPKIRKVEASFDSPPLVLFHEDLKADPRAFIQQIADFMGVRFDYERISLKPKHKSYNDHQLKVIRGVSEFLFPVEKSRSHKRWINYLQYRSKWLVCHLFLYIAPLIPRNTYRGIDLIPPKELERIREYLEDDWNQCKEYARQHNP